MWYVPVLKGLDAAFTFFLLVPLIGLLAHGPYNSPGPIIAVGMIILMMGALVGALFI